MCEKVWSRPYNHIVIDKSKILFEQTGKGVKSCDPGLIITLSLINRILNLNKQAKPSLLYIMITLLNLNLVIMILLICVKRCDLSMTMYQ